MSHASRPSYSDVVSRAIALDSLAYRAALEDRRSHLQLRDWQTEKTRAKVTADREANEADFRGFTDWAAENAVADALTARERSIWELQLGEFDDECYALCDSACYALAVLTWWLGMDTIAPLSLRPDMEAISDALHFGEPDPKHAALKSLGLADAKRVIRQDDELRALDLALVLYVWRVRKGLKARRTKVDVVSEARSRFGDLGERALQYVWVHETTGDLMWWPHSLVLHSVNKRDLIPTERAMLEQLKTTRWLSGETEDLDSFIACDELLTSAST